MKQLSFKFYWKFSKCLMVVTSIIANVLLLLFLVYYPLWGGDSKMQVFCFLMSYILISGIFDYYLMKSKSVKYDSDFLYIENGNDNWRKISIKSVVKIKRTYYYFCTIYCKRNDMLEDRIVFFLSPNPSFFKSKEVKEVLFYAKQ